MRSIMFLCFVGLYALAVCLVSSSAFTAEPDHLGRKEIDEQMLMQQKIVEALEDTIELDILVVQPSKQAPTSNQQKEADHIVGHILKMEERVRKNPNDLDAWVRLGNLYFDSGKPAYAINAYEQALILKPDNPDVLTDMGIMYHETGKYSIALELFHKASLINPRHQNALYNRGVVSILSA